MERAGEHIRIQHLEKRFGATPVLKDVNMSIARGEVAVVIGGSGAGKTTLLKILIGLDRATSGSVLVDGVDLCKLRGRELAAMRKKFGMVFQYSALLDSMNVLDNVAFPLREHTKLKEKEIRQRVKDKLSQLKLENVEDKFPSQLSGGMRKRVGLARALMLEPQAILYDEPTSGLDPKTSRLVDDLILETRETFGVTSIVISHDMAGALLMGDHIFMLARGEVVASGTARELVDSQHELVQEFLDSSGIAPERMLREKATNART
jgi:phospholipid/cholesterol/gamma-HCH transport system ATP-binding protein